MSVTSGSIGSGRDRQTIGWRRRRVKTPTILQMEALECGAAALAMVLAYHGRWVALEELRDLCGVSRDGSKAVNILKAARSLGMEAKGMRLEPAGLESIPLPAILFVDMNHFVVLEGLDSRHFYLNDPAVGRRKVSAAEFDGMFSGIALVFEKSADFQPGGVPRQLSSAFYQLVKGSLRALAAILALGGVMVAIMLIVPTFSRIFIDYFLVENLTGWLTPLLIAMTVAGVTLGLSTWLGAHLIARLQAKLSLTLGGRLSWHILRLPPSFFTQRHSGMISARLPLTEQIAELAARQLTHMAVSITALTFFAGLMVQYHAGLTLACVSLASVNVLVFVYVQKRLGESSETIALQAVKMNGKVMQGLQMIETLKATGADDVFFSKWAGLQVLFINAQQRVAHLHTLLGSLPALTSALTSALVLALGGLFVINDELTVGMLVAFIFIVGSFSAPVGELMEIIGALRNAQGPLAQIDDALCHPVDEEFNHPDKRTLPAQGRHPTKLSGRVSLRGIDVGYSQLDGPLIKDLNLEMAPGSRVALVGGSGSGKTTVGRLLAGLLTPWSGQFLLDGKLAADWPRELLRGSLSVVDQEIILFEGTVRDNLSLWDTSMPLDRVVQAAKDAMIHEIIASRRGGYDASIEEDGRNFSGGQRQRLEIARALTCNPSLLILDEATSALDTLTERAIMDNLRRRGCTCVIIAHRLSTIRDCDEIIVLDHGKVIERGTHQQLMHERGVYRELIEN